LLPFPLFSLSFLSLPLPPSLSLFPVHHEKSRPCHHDVLPHLRCRISGGTNYEQNPLKPKTKINPSSLEVVFVSYSATPKKILTSLIYLPLNDNPALLKLSECLPPLLLLRDL
jgi:hypothetical protein